MVGIQLFLPLLQTIRSRGGRRERDEEEQDRQDEEQEEQDEAQLEETPSNDLSPRCLEGPMPAKLDTVKRGWFGQTIAFIFQYDRPPEFSPRYR